MDAYTKIELLHRDISPNNILIYDDPGQAPDEYGKGLLSDWDLARSLKEISKEQTSQTSRSVSHTVLTVELR